MRKDAFSRCNTVSSPLTQYSSCCSLLSIHFTSRISTMSFTCPVSAETLIQVWISNISFIPHREPEIASLIRNVPLASSVSSQDGYGAREGLFSLSYSLSAVLETPGETIPRIRWEEVNSCDVTQMSVTAKQYRACKICSKSECG